VKAQSTAHTYSADTITQSTRVISDMTDNVTDACCSTDRHRQTQTQTDRDTDRHRETQTDTDTERSISPNNVVAALCSSILIVRKKTLSTLVTYTVPGPPFITCQSDHTHAQSQLVLSQSNQAQSISK